MIGWNCLGGSEISPSTCFPKCGDGIAVDESECDDGEPDDN